MKLRSIILALLMPACLAHAQNSALTVDATTGQVTAYRKGGDQTLIFDTPARFSLLDFGAGAANWKLFPISNSYFLGHTLALGNPGTSDPNGYFAGRGFQFWQGNSFFPADITFTGGQLLFRGGVNGYVFDAPLYGDGSHLTGVSGEAAVTGLRYGNGTNPDTAATAAQAATLLSGGIGTLNLSGYTLTLPQAAVVSALAGANISIESLTAAGGSIQLNGGNIVGNTLYLAGTAHTPLIDVGGAGDVFLTRGAAGTVAIGNGTPGDAGGTLQLNILSAGGNVRGSNILVNGGYLLLGLNGTGALITDGGDNHTIVFRNNSQTAFADVQLGNLTASGTITGNASGATNLNASSVSSGTLPAARLPASVVQYDVSDNIITDGNVIAGSVVTTQIYSGAGGDPSIDLSDASTGHLRDDGVNCLEWYYGAITIPGNLDVYNNLTVNNDVVFNGPVQANADLQIGGSLTTSSQFVYGDVNCYANFYTSGDVTFDGPITANSSFVVNDNASFYGHVTIPVDLTVGGIYSLEDFVTEGGVYFGGNLSTRNGDVIIDSARNASLNSIVLYTTINDSVGNVIYDSLLGPIYHSPDGTAWYLTVGDTGNIQTQSY